MVTLLHGELSNDVYLIGKEGKDLGQLDVFEIDAGGRRIFVEQKDGTGIGKINPSTGRPFRDPVVALNEFGEKQILEAGRTKATALRDAVATRGDKGAAVPTIQEIQQSKVIRFEVKADTPEMRAEVGKRLNQLQSEFPSIQFEVKYGVQ